MKTISLGFSGLFAICDDADFDFLMRFSWCIMKKGNCIYAQTKIDGKTVYMHRLLLNPPKGICIDHINNNGLDNRRVNLRLATYLQNNANQKKQPGKTSTFKGVSFIKSKGKWKAQISLNGFIMHLGYFFSERDAALAYDKAAREHFGAFAHTNFPNEIVQ